MFFAHLKSPFCLSYMGRPYWSFATEPSLPAVDQSHHTLVGNVRANVGMWQVWQATFCAWRFSWSFGPCGDPAWQSVQLSVCPPPATDTPIDLPGIACFSARWQALQDIFAPSTAMCTSIVRLGAAMELSRSPCLMWSPPPPKKWHAPQVARLVGPTFFAIFSRSTAFQILPDLGGNSVSW